MGAGGPRRGAGEGDVLAPGLVHELRQPLTGLDAGLRLVARDLGTIVTNLDGWKIATGQLARVQETLDTYQQLMTPGRAPHGPFTPASVVRRAMDALRFRLDALEGRFSVAVEGEIPLAHGSAQALHHAVTNLVANALDAVHEAGDRGRVEVRVLRAPGDPARSQVRVADEGVGIPPARRSRLFTPRFTTKGAQGNGLGLALSRRMLRTAGGELRLAPDGDPARRPWAATEFVVDLPATADAPVPHDAPASTANRPRAAVVRVALAAAVLACVGLGFAGMRRPSPARASAAPVAAEGARDHVEVVELEGALEVLRPGGWEPLSRGRLLHSDETLRTGAGARATLTIGDGSRVEVSDATQVTVRELTAAVQRLRLSRGRLSVDHRPDGARVVVVESERGDAVAKAGAARFSVLANGAALAVATETGVVHLQAANRAVDVAPGEQSVSYRGQAPTAPTRIPASLLVRIARAALAKGTCVVEGVVERGSEIRVDGHVVEPGADGRFTAGVPAARGQRHASVVTRDASGRVRARRVACAESEAEHDLSDFAVRWGQDATTGRR